MEQERLSAGNPPATPKTKRRWLGTVIAVLLVAGLGALAWHLTHKPATGGAPKPCPIQPVAHHFQRLLQPRPDNAYHHAARNFGELMVFLTNQLHRQNFTLIFLHRMHVAVQGF